VIVRPGAQEAGTVRDGLVVFADLTEERLELALAHAGGEVQPILEDHRLGYVGEEVVDASDADDGEHVLLILGRQRDIGHG
jgi:hypothetical protein